MMNGSIMHLVTEIHLDFASVYCFSDILLHRNYKFLSKFVPICPNEMDMPFVANFGYGDNSLDLPISLCVLLSFPQNCCQDLFYWLWKIKLYELSCKLYYTACNCRLFQSSWMSNFVAVTYSSRLSTLFCGLLANDSSAQLSRAHLFMQQRKSIYLS